MCPHYRISKPAAQAEPLTLRPQSLCSFMFTAFGWQSSHLENYLAPFSATFFWCAGCRELLAALPETCPPVGSSQVEGQHALWTGVSDPYKHTIRAFLVHFHSAILRHSSERFNFRNGSIGKTLVQHAS